MEITSEQLGEVAVVRVSGSVDAGNAGELAAGLAAPIEDGTPRVVLDCAGLRYISSAGLRAILGTLKQAKAAGGELVLAGVQKDVERVLRISGFTQLLRLVPDADAAVTNLG